MIHSIDVARAFQYRLYAVQARPGAGSPWAQRGLNKAPHLSSEPCVCGCGGGEQFCQGPCTGLPCRSAPETLTPRLGPTAGTPPFQGLSQPEQAGGRWELRAIPTLPALRSPPAAPRQLEPVGVRPRPAIPHPAPGTRLRHSHLLRTPFKPRDCPGADVTSFSLHPSCSTSCPQRGQHHDKRMLLPRVTCPGTQGQRPRISRSNSGVHHSLAMLPPWSPELLPSAPRWVQGKFTTTLFLLGRSPFLGLTGLPRQVEGSGVPHSTPPTWPAPAPPHPTPRPKANGVWPTSDNPDMAQAPRMLLPCNDVRCSVPQ